MAGRGKYALEYTLTHLPTRSTTTVLIFYIDQEL